MCSQAQFILPYFYLLSPGVWLVPLLKTDKNKRRKLYDRKERNVYYALSRKLLDLMLQSGYLDWEEYEKIDALNREIFSPELAQVYA